MMTRPSSLITQSTRSSENSNHLRNERCVQQDLIENCVRSAGPRKIYSEFFISEINESQNDRNTLNEVKSSWCIKNRYVGFLKGSYRSSKSVFTVRSSADQSHTDLKPSSLWLVKAQRSPASTTTPLPISLETRPHPEHTHTLQMG